MPEIDQVLKELIAQRDSEIMTLQQARMEQMRAMEERGQSRARAVLDSLSRDMAETIRSLDRAGSEQATDAQNYITEVRERLLQPAEVAPTDLARQLPAQRALVAAQLYAYLNPYYAKIYNANGDVYWEGYSPGRIWLSNDARGSGNGWFGSGAQAGTVLVDWWYYFWADTSRYYSYTINVPYHGFVICYADDGFWDSKQATTRIDLSAVGWQDWYRETTTVTPLSYDGQNIDVNTRFDQVYSLYYSDLLGGPKSAYLRATSSFYVYARGGGSHAELYFGDGTANYIDAPWVYVT
jgi:hypothetical protein